MPMLGYVPRLNICLRQSPAWALVRAGLGYSLLPFYPGSDKKGLCYIPVTGIPPLAFGLYHKGVKGNTILKEFIRLLDEEVAAGEFRA